MVVNSAGVIWHDLECGSYRADLPLWRELAERSASDGVSARILDVGAGTGRVALDLARCGHRVTAVELDAELIDALRERAEGASVQIVCADARTFDLQETEFDLCLMPMQTAQLLGGSEQRVAFLRRALAHLRPDGMLALAIVTAFDTFDCSDGDVAPSPEWARVDGVLYLSRATRVRILADGALIERERWIYGERPHANAIELDLLDAPGLEREGIQAGFHPERARELPPTHDHVGSTVVMLRA